ncbi:unnamed protein product, partial [Pylaiella littoralis]
NLQGVGSFQRNGRRRRSKRAESAAAPIVKVNSGTPNATGKPETPPSSLAATPTTSTAPNGRKRKRKGADPAAAPIIEADSGTATATDLENTSAGFAPSAAPAAASESGRCRSGRVIVKSRRATESKGVASIKDSDG